MPLSKTYEEVLASNINPRNYSDILPIIYKLRRRQNNQYVPSAFERVVYSSKAIGQDGASAVFDALSSSSFARGATITLSGTATYKLMTGATLFGIKPAVQVTAQIDIGRQGPPTSLPAYQVECLASEINSSGIFSFVIPAAITEKLSIGTHYVYIDAHSPDNPPVRLTASGAENNERSFTITA